MCQYMRDYASHFGLGQHYRLGVTVNHIDRSEDGKSWAIKMTDKSHVKNIETFDKVLVANGSFEQAYTPKIEDMYKFKGRIIHSQGFKE